MNSLKRWTMGFLKEGEPSGGGGGGEPSGEPSGNAPSGDSTILNPGDPPSGVQPSGGEPSGEPTAFRLNVYNDEGELSEDFVKSLSDEHKGLAKHFGKYKGENATSEAIKGLFHMSKRAQQAELQPLGPNATEDERKEHDAMVKTALGIPETPGDYQLNLPEGMDKDSVDKEFVNSLKEFAHSANVTQSDFDAFTPILLNREAAIHKSYADADAKLVRDGVEALGKEWGDNKEANFAMAVKGAQRVDPSIDPGKDPAFKHATTVRLAHKVAELTADDSRPGGGGGSAGSGGNYREQSRAIAQDPNNQWYKAYHDAKHPDHTAAVAEKSRLSKLAHQSGQA